MVKAYLDPMSSGSDSDPALVHKIEGDVGIEVADETDSEFEVDVEIDIVIEPDFDFESDSDLDSVVSSVEVISSHYPLPVRLLNVHKNRKKMNYFVGKKEGTGKRGDQIEKTALDHSCWNLSKRILALIVGVEVKRIEQKSAGWH